MKLTESTLVLFLISFLLLSLVHNMAMQWSLYYTYPWFDILTHFWGGTLIAMGSQTTLFARVFGMRPWSLMSTLGLVLVVGGAWEVFEWYAGIAGIVTYLMTVIDNYETLYVLDTVKDLILDLIGGVVGYRVAQSLNTLNE